MAKGHHVPTRSIVKGIGPAFGWLALAAVVGGCGDTRSGGLADRHEIRPLPPDLPPEVHQQAEGLYSPAPETRAHAARRLAAGGQKSISAIPMLLDALNDEDRRVRSCAAEALGEIGSPDAVEPLIAVLERDGEDWEVQASAAEALGKLGDARAAQPLIASLANMVSHVRYQAAVALGEVGGPEAVAALESTARYDGDMTVRFAAEKSLRKLRRDGDS